MDELKRSELTPAILATNLNSVTMHPPCCYTAYSTPPHASSPVGFTCTFMFVSRTKRFDLLMNPFGFASLIKRLGILIGRDASSQHIDRW